eukprot:1398988-Rhodomonas_salina.2
MSGTDSADGGTRELHPTIWHYKQMLSQLAHRLCRDLAVREGVGCAEERTILMTIDLHGHSRAKNVFIYGKRAAWTSRSEGVREEVPGEEAGDWMRQEGERKSENGRGGRRRERKGATEREGRKEAFADGRASELQRQCVCACFIRALQACRRVASGCV